MKERPITTRYPVDLLATLKRLAEEHERSFNSEVIYALRQYTQKEGMHMYEVQYEIATEDQQVINDTMTVEATSEERAREYAIHVLEEQHEGGTLLECRVVG